MAFQWLRDLLSRNRKPSRRESERELRERLQTALERHRQELDDLDDDGQALARRVRANAQRGAALLGGGRPPL